MTYQVVILTGHGPEQLTFERFAGPHRIATEIRKHDFSCKVVYGINWFEFYELIEILNLYIDNNTLCLGLSGTFLMTFKPVQKKNMLYTSEALNQDYMSNKFVDNFEKICLYYKKKYPKLKIVIGGHRASSKIPNCNYVDAFFEGYADTTFVNYLISINNNKIYLGQQKFVDTYGSNFNFHNSSIKYTDEDDIFFNEALNIELTRGCIFKCKFCTFPLLGRNDDDNYIKNSDIIYSELMNNYEKYGTTNYIFSDDTYNESVTKIYNLYKIFEKLPFKINFTTYLRIDLIYRYPEMIDILLKSGLRGAFFGLETFNESARKKIGKGLSNDKLLQIIDRINKAWKNEVIINDSFILGLPEETKQSILQWTEDILFKTKLFDDHCITIRPLWLTNWQNTFKSEFERNLDKYNFKIPENGWEWSNDTTSYNECTELSNVIMQKVNSIPRPSQAFLIPILLGYGFKLDQLRNVNNIEFAKKVRKITIERYNQYKNRLLKI